MLEINGAAKVILEQNLTGESLFNEIRDIMRNETLHGSMSVASKQLGKPDSAHIIVKEMKQIAKL
ncbi:undecaprenyldiphospho-muramoylpentapeptide beta-N- acetylglucosaminyltransferase [compost metagenome]